MINSLTLLTVVVLCLKLDKFVYELSPVPTDLDAIFTSLSLPEKW